MNTTYLPPSVRELSDAELPDYAIERADYIPSTRFYLAEWNDRKGWYYENTQPEDYGDGSFRFCATVFNESECFATAEAMHAWLWERVETHS